MENYTQETVEYEKELSIILQQNPFAFARPDVPIVFREVQNARGKCF